MPGLHPRQILWGAQAQLSALPVCDHFSGSEKRMRKSLQLQADMTQEFGSCVFDVTLDCEDGAAVGGEAEQAALVAELALNAAPEARVAARVHALGHSAFTADLQTIVGTAGHRLTHLMVPKVESAAEVTQIVLALDKSGSVGAALPLHVLIESALAVRNAFEIAAHPRVQSLSFGLMDFVSSHGGAIPASAMTSAGQFTYPLVLHAKLGISAACHAYGKVPSHCVVTEFNDTAALQTAARRAASEWGYTRMWSIHPSQIRPILAAFAPSADEVQTATKIIAAALEADWAPIRFDHVLHDRASYRYFWQVLERAQRQGQLLAPKIQAYFEPTG